METKQITTNEIYNAIKEIGGACHDGKSGWCGECHIGELAEKLGIEMPKSAQ